MERFSELVPGVLVATSDRATLNSVAVTGEDGGCVLIDPGISVSDLAGIAADLAESGLRVEVGFATHPHWDHVIWSRALGDVPRYAAPAAVMITETEREGMVSYLQETTPGHDLELFGRLLALPEGADEIPWSGPRAELIIHDGHAPGHAAVFFPGTGVLVAGDMLSDIEIPTLDTLADDPLGDYRTGLERLGALSGVRWVIPGHGHIGDAGEFRERLAKDMRYLDLLAAGSPFEDPRCGEEWLRAAHASQLRIVGGR